MIKLNYILPRLLPSALYIQNKKTSPQSSIWPLSLFLIMALIGITMALAWRYYGIDWRSQLIERYAIIISVDSDDKVYYESIRQRLGILLSNEDVTASYEILDAEEIREQLQEAFSDLPEKYNYTLPIIAYIQGLNVSTEELTTAIQAIHKDAKVEDNGEWVDSIRAVADIFYNIGSIVPWIIIALVIPVIYFNITQLISSQLGCLNTMLMLGAKEKTICSLFARYSLHWTVLATITAISVYCLALLILYLGQPLLLSESPKLDLIQKLPLVIGLSIPFISLIAWGIGWWSTAQALKTIE